jgi:pyruvate/2-oxoglutarate dehydrogenase complex dihydrolipoamide dehydrogenase (E3) component
MPQVLTPDLCVIGAGPGGLAAAIKAASYGVRVVLVERGRMGGQAWYSGSLASKSLLAAAKQAHAIKNAWMFGLKVDHAGINHAAIVEYALSAGQALAQNVSPERLNGLGIDVIQGSARFTGPGTAVAGDYEIRARRFIVATGSSALVPPIPGLDRIPYFTSESVFSQLQRMPHLIVLGGSSAGIEFAQAFRRLGSDVTVVEAGAALPHDDPEMRAYLLKCLKDEGIRVLENARAERVETFGSGIQVIFAMAGKTYSVDGTHVLVAMGRRANVAGLDLDAAGVAFSDQGIQVSKGLRSSNKKVYAIGDVTGETHWAHAAEHHASVAVQNALFRLPACAHRETMPWVTFTDPELAHVGLTEEAARARHGKLTIVRWPYSENLRAHAERQTGGFLKVIASKSGQILGAGIVGAQAGELIQVWSLAMQKNIPLRDMASIVPPSPTLGEINKMAAESYFVPQAQSPLLRRIIRLLAKLG